MKFTYQKPSYRFVLLETGASSSCVFTNNYDWQVCGVSMPNGDIVFMDDKNCDTDPTDTIQDLCQFTGAHNSSVFGS